ncbi:MAG: hypothetical protein GF364_19820 [Candidatus Lokiarchaeota archaeon]|nr:hypothetical protein [Candidatus Lokiarchaeota archaeon]
MASGILGDYINATVALSGFMNFTNWLTADNGILETNNVDFSMTDEKIDLLSVNGQDLAPNDMDKLLYAYRFFRGDDKLFKESIIEGTTSLNRTLLRKLDAVEYLDNARSNSIMFVHPTLDNSFANTNQSGQGFEASTNGAYYLPVEYTHGFEECADVDWIVLNFLKEKLKGETLASKSNLYEYYTQETDSLGFVYNQINVNMNNLILKIIIILIPAIPVCLIVNIIYKSKKLETDRAKEDYPEDLKQLRFTGATFRKLLTGYFAQCIVSILLFWVCTYGLESVPVILVISMVFYISFYFTMIYTHDDAEIKRNLDIPFNEELKKEVKIDVRNKNKIIELFILSVVIVCISSIFFGLIVPHDSIFHKPLDSLSMVFLGVGAVLVVSGLVFIDHFKKKLKMTDNEFTWRDLDLDRYSIMRSLTYGTAIGLNFILMYNIIVFVLRFPFILGARNVYFIFVMAAFILFSVGVRIWVEIILKISINSIFPKQTLRSKTLSWLITTLIGMVLCFLSGFFIGLGVLGFGTFIQLPLPLILGLILGGIYIISKCLELISANTGVLSATIYLPIILVTFIGFFFRI